MKKIAIITLIWTFFATLSILNIVLVISNRYEVRPDTQIFIFLFTFIPLTIIGFLVTKKLME
jgi:hypothetical protein